GAISPLIGALDDEALTVIALSALRYLSLYMRDPRISDAMVRLLETPRTMVETDHAVQILEELKDPRLAEVGLRLLDQAPVVIPNVDGMVLSQAEAYHRSSVRSRGAFAFAKFARNATEELVKRLTHENPDIRAAAAAALQEDPNRSLHLMQHLTPLLNDVDTAVRQQASNTLQSLEQRPQKRIEISPARHAEIE